VLAVAWWNRPPPAASDIDAKPLVAGVWISEQVAPAQLPELASEGFKAVVDLRPNGEMAGQPSSDEVSEAAKRAGLAFSYVPVAHGDIAADSVAALDRALSASGRPVLLYCRSGRRAARTWALVEASRSGGLDADAIEAAVRSAGQSADDLKQDISRRIAARAGH